MSTESAAASSHQIGESSCRGIRSSDRRSIYVPASAMKITWGNDERFWKRAQLSKDDRLPRELADGGGAELVQVNWLEATGSVVLESIVSGSYEVFFHVKFKGDAFGWSKSSVTMAVAAGGRREKRNEMMENYRRRGVEVWHEIRVGEFTVAAADKGVVEFGMWDVDNSWWKGGLVFAGVSIRPKNGNK